MIAIIDYGMGNLGSVLNMFKKINVKAKITGDQEEINNADKLLLPGVGAFDTAIDNIRKRGLFQLLNHLVLEEKKPLLGICLGMQLLLNSSEEGVQNGFGWIEGSVKSFKNRIPEKYKVPHMGWNNVEIVNNSKLYNGFEDEIKFYFVHTFYAEVSDSANCAARCNYGIDFDASIEKGNIFGAQFHPEKSHKFGMKLLNNFAQL